MRRLRKLALALLACLLFAVVAPLYFAERRIDDSFAIATTVSAAPRDLHVITVPVRLSDAPDLTLMRAVIYDYGPSAPSSAPDSAPGAAPGVPGRPISQAILDGPVFTLNASGRRAALAVSRGEAEGAATASPPDSQTDPLSPVLQQIALLGFDLITIRRGTLHVTALDGNVETLTDIQAEIKRTRKGQVTSIGSFTVRGQRLAFEATLSQPADKKLPRRWHLQVSFKSRLLQGAFEGHADLREDFQLSGQVELSTSSLRAVGRWFGLPLLSADSLGATNVKGELTWARRALAFDKARIVVDGNEGNGRLVLNLGGTRPLLEATLDFAALNLTPYIEAARTQIFGFELPVTWGASFDISLPMIRHLDADLRVSARRVTLRSYTLGQGAATITAQAGKLHADITELELPSGTLSAQVTAIMSEAAPRYALRAKIEKLEIGSVSAVVAGAPALSGQATLAVDLTATGYSLADLAKRLSGKATLAMPEGGRMALDLKALRAAAKTGVRGWAELAKSPTSLDRLEARALIIEGVAFTEEVQARAGDVALMLTGRFGIADGNMDARLMLKAGAAPPDQPLRLVDAAVETLTLRGPWASPEVRGEDGEPPLRDSRAAP